MIRTLSTGKVGREHRVALPLQRLRAIRLGHLDMADGQCALLQKRLKAPEHCGLSCGREADMLKVRNESKAANGRDRTFRGAGGRGRTGTPLGTGF